MSPKKITAGCPIRTTLEMLGGKWRLLIIHEIGHEPRHYSDLRQAIPDISEKMLVQELKNLIDNDLVERRSHREGRTRVTYALTANGHRALALVEPIRTFGLDYTKK